MRKNVTKILLAVLLTIVGSVGIDAQERILSERKYTEACTIGEKNLYTGNQGPFRLIVSTDVINEGRPELDYSLRSATSFVPGQISHRMEEKVVGGKPSKGETFSQGNRSFSRGTDGQWNEIFGKKVYIGTEGNYYRYELNATARNGDHKSQTKIVTEAYADPTITITVPQIAK